MFNMLVGKNLAYEIGGNEVFAGVDIAISQGDKVGLIGPNGAGKTSLLRVLSGEALASAGAVIGDDVEVGLLPQNLEDRYEQTVYDFVEEVTGVRSVRTAYEAAESEYQADTDDQDKLMRYVEAAERLGFFEVDTFSATFEKALKRAGLPADVADSKIGQLSGGQRTRVALAAIMATRHNVVLLDEPTNNLDMEGVKILERYIRRAPAAFLMVSHDRRFLRNTTNRIVELLGNDRGVNNYGLGYDEYVAARIKAYEADLKRYEAHQTNVRGLEASLREQRMKAASGTASSARRTDNDKLTANYRAGRAAGHAGQQARALESRLEQLQEATPRKPQEPISLDFMFQDEALRSKTLLDVHDLTVKYDTPNGPLTFGPYDLHLAAGERVAITGPNGSGKSTLVKAILGQLETTTGNHMLNPNARIAYIDQAQTLPSPEETPLSNLLRLAPGLPRSEAMNLLVKFNLDADMVTSMRAENLSGGERAKVLLASVAAKQANLLVLDEPTNNLDIPTIEGLQDALRTYTGGILLVSHDRDFIDGIGITRSIAL